MVWKDIYTLNYIFRLRILLIQGLFQDGRNDIGIMSNDSPLKRLRGYVCHTHARYCFVFIHTAPYISLYFLRQYVSNVLALLLTRCRSFGYIEVFPRHIQHFHIKTLTHNGLHPCRPSRSDRIPKGTRIPTNV